MPLGNTDGSFGKILMTLLCTHINQFELHPLPVKLTTQEIFYGSKKEFQ